MADDVVVFNKADLPLLAYPSYEDIRRRGKLCDVTLKVIVICTRCRVALTINYVAAFFLSSEYK